MKTINKRNQNASKLAKKFPELKGLSFEEMLEKIPIELDFITANELYEKLNLIHQNNTPKRIKLKTRLTGINNLK